MKKIRPVKKVEESQGFPFVDTGNNSKDTTKGPRKYEASIRGMNVNSGCEITIVDSNMVLYDGNMYVKITPPFEKEKVYVKVWENNIEIFINERGTDNS